MSRRLIAPLIFLALFCASAPEVVHELFHTVASPLEHAHDGGDCCHLHAEDSGHSVQDELAFTTLPRRQDFPSASRPAALPGQGSELLRSRPGKAVFFAEDTARAAPSVPLLPQLSPIPPPYSPIA